MLHKHITQLSTCSEFSPCVAMQTSFLTLGQVKELNLGQKEKPDYFSVTASVIFARKENCLYKACPTEECNKKVTEDNMGGYFCEKCNRSFDKFKYRMILMVRTTYMSVSVTHLYLLLSVYQFAVYVQSIYVQLKLYLRI